MHQIRLPLGRQSRPRWQSLQSSPDPIAVYKGIISNGMQWEMNWIVQCFTSPPTQYRLYGRLFLQVKRPNQQYQSTEGSYKGKQHKEQRKHKIHMHRHTKKKCSGKERRGKEGDGGFPLQLGILDLTVKEGREGRRARKEAWVGSSIHFSTLALDGFQSNFDVCKQDVII